MKLGRPSRNHMRMLQFELELSFQVHRAMDFNGPDESHPEVRDEIQAYLFAWAR